MNGAPEPQTAARASPLVGPYPIDEDALRRLKRLHDGGVIDDYTFRCRKAEALGLTRKAARTRLRLSLLHLPADVLSKIASHAVVPALVVAAGKDLHGARGQRGPMLLDILCQQPRTTTNLRFTQYFGEKLVLAEIIASAARFPPPGTSAVDSCRPM